MNNKISKKKLLFYHHLLQLPQDSLAWQIAQTQINLGLPGLTQECSINCKEMKFPNPGTLSKMNWKRPVNQKIKDKNKNDLLSSMERYKKLDTNKHREENFELKPYMTNLTMQAAQLKFAIRSKMMKTVKLNFKNDKIQRKPMEVLF